MWRGRWCCGSIIRRDLFDYDDLIGGDQYVTEEVPYFITVPTTAGTGSEVGRSAIISEDDTHRKRILFSPKLLAKIVFADPMLTMELPPFVTAATGMDALTHNLEAYLAKMFHPMCEGIALEGIALINGSLAEAVHRPDLESAQPDAAWVADGCGRFSERARRGAFAGASAVFVAGYPSWVGECGEPAVWDATIISAGVRRSLGVSLPRCGYPVGTGRRWWSGCLRSTGKLACR